MKRRIISLTGMIVISIIALISYVNFFKREYEVKKIIPRCIFGKEGYGISEFKYPFSLAIKDKYLFVADLENNRIQVLEIHPDGALSAKFTFGKEGKELGEFNFPCGLAIKDKYLFVADGRIQVLEIHPDGALSAKFTFGKEGKGLGEFGKSINLYLAIKDKYLFVAEGVNNRIQILEIHPDGALSAKFTFGKEGRGLGEFGKSFRPLDFFISPINLTTQDKYLYVADSSNSRIQILEIRRDGTLLAKFAFGKEGKGLGEFGLPLGLAIKDNYLFIADSGNHRIQVLEIRY